jgi:hypothetical protein
MSSDEERVSFHEGLGTVSFNVKRKLRQQRLYISDTYQIIVIFNLKTNDEWSMMKRQVAPSKCRFRWLSKGIAAQAPIATKPNVRFIHWKAIDHPSLLTIP